VGAVCSPELVEGSTAIYSIGQTLSDVSYERRLWPRAASQIEKETMKKRITNIEQGMSNIEVMYPVYYKRLSEAIPPFVNRHSSFVIP
jgi:hypothetical protein